MVRPDWNGYNIMHDSAGRVGALDLGFLPGPHAAEAPKAKLVWLLNSDDFDAADIPDDAFVIYQVRVVSMHNRAGSPLPGQQAAEAPKPKLVWLLNSDDLDAADIPDDAFVISQVQLACAAAAERLHLPHKLRLQQHAQFGSGLTRWTAAARWRFFGLVRVWQWQPSSLLLDTALCADSYSATAGAPR